MHFVVSFLAGKMNKNMYVTYNDVTICREEKKTESHHLHVFLLFKTNRMNDRFIGFHQLIQKLDRITRIILLFKTSKTNTHFIGFHRLIQKVRLNNTNHFFFIVFEQCCSAYKQQQCPTANHKPVQELSTASSIVAGLQFFA